MNKKPIHKIKKVVIDPVDGKIINEKYAIKPRNISEYLEKNGLKIIKLFTILLILGIFSSSVYAFEIDKFLNVDLSNDSNIKLILGFGVLIVSLIFYSFKNDIYYLYIFSSFCLLLLGFVLIINGFSPILSVLVILLSLFLLIIGSGL